MSADKQHLPPPESYPIAWSLQAVSDICNFSHSQLIMSNTPKKSTGKSAGALGAGNRNAAGAKGGSGGGDKGGNGGGDKGGAGGRGQPETGKKPPRRCDDPDCPMKWHQGTKVWTRKITSGCPKCKGVGLLTLVDCGECFYHNRKSIESNGKEDCPYCNKDRKQELIDPVACDLCEGGTKEPREVVHCLGSGRTR